MSNERLITMALDPLRPVDGRLSAARLLDAAGRRELESRLLADLPALWGLEWRQRLALLGAVGGRAAMEELVDLREGDQLPELERVEAAIDTAIERIESRLAASESPATAEARAGS